VNSLESIVRVYEINDSISAIIKKLLESLKWKRVIKTGDKVFVKINLSLDRVYPGANTSKEFIGPLVALLRDRASEVRVGDSNPSACNADKAMNILGLRKAIQKNGGTPINLSKDKRILVENDEALYLKKIELPRCVVNADKVLSASLLKTFGIIPGLKVIHHPHLNEALSDLLFLVRPCLALTDGIIGMEGRGPVEGEPVIMNLVMGGNDFVSHDVVASRLIGADPTKVKHIMLCARRGLGKPSGFNVNKYEHLVRRFKPPDHSPVTIIQEKLVRDRIGHKLFFRTPAYHFFKFIAKSIKDINRWWKITRGFK